MPIGDVLAQVAPIAGTLIGGPVGGAIGTVASGLIQGVGADKKRKEYEALEKTIPMQDPAQVAFLEQMRSRRSSLEAGTDAMTSNRIMQARNAGAQTQSNIVRAGGGNVSDLLRAQNVTNQAVGMAGAQANQSALGLMAQEGTLVGSMAERAYQRQMSRANVLWQDYARQREDANRTTMAGIGMLPQVGVEGGFKGLLGKSGFTPNQGVMTSQIASSLPAGRFMSDATTTSQSLMGNPGRMTGLSMGYEPLY